MRYDATSSYCALRIRCHTRPRGQCIWQRTGKVALVVTTHNRPRVPGAYYTCTKFKPCWTDKSAAEFSWSRSVAKAPPANLWWFRASSLGSLSRRGWFNAARQSRRKFMLLWSLEMGGPDLTDLVLRLIVARGRRRLGGEILYIHEHLDKSAHTRGCD